MEYLTGKSQRTVQKARTPETLKVISRSRSSCALFPFYAHSWIIIDPLEVAWLLTPRQAHQVMIWWCGGLDRAERGTIG